MMKKIIAITGLKGSGKDTTADYIIQNYHNWEKDSFAGILKDITSILFSWDRKMLAGETVSDREKREQKDDYWSEKFGREITPRNMLQFLGTDVLRTHLHTDIWVNALERKIMSTDKNIIITDCRFKNEIIKLKDLGAIFIRVERDKPKWFDKVAELNQKGYNMPGIKNLVPEVANIHISELDWIGIDNPNYILKVNGDFNYLYDQIKMIKEIQ